MNVIVKAFKAGLDVINTPETYRKGEEFQEYVRHYVFPKERYTCLHKSHDYAENKGDFVEDTKEPDFKFRSENGVTFFVEAKFRSHYYNGAIEWCRPYQLRRYKEIGKDTIIYVVIGVGEHPNNPAELFFMPLKDIKYAKLFRSFLRDYNVPLKKCISESQLD